MTKKFGLHCLPAKFDVPAFGEMRNALELGDRLVDRQQHVGEDRADDEIDLIALEEPLDFGHRDVRLQFVVDDGHLRVEPAELAAERLDREVEAVAHLPAEHRGGSREGHDEPDFHLVLGGRADGRSRPCGQRREKDRTRFHLSTPLARVTRFPVFRRLPLRHSDA